MLNNEIHLDIIAHSDTYIEYIESCNRIQNMLPIIKLQSKLSTLLSEIHYQHVFNMLPTTSITTTNKSRSRVSSTIPTNLLGQKLSFVGMQSSESGAWLMANPRMNPNQLSNSQFSESLRTRLGIPLFAFPFQCVCGENCDEMGFHAYTCCKSKCERSERNERHQHIKVAVWDMLQHFLPNVLKHNEPYMIPTFTKINPPDIDPECLHIPQRADLAVKDLNDHVFNYYVDYTITHPGSTALRSKYNKVGYAAEQVAQINGKNMRLITIFKVPLISLKWLCLVLNHSVPLLKKAKILEKHVLV
jgi:hypothetical protein